MNKGRIEKEWQELLDHIRDPRMQPVQIREMQKCFFAGAMAMRNILLRDVSEGDEITDDDEALMNGLDAEFQEFSDGVVEEARRMLAARTDQAKGG